MSDGADVAASGDGGDGNALARLRDRVRARVVGRRAEIDVVLAALDAGADILLEGPPGCSKSTLLRAIAAQAGTSLSFVEGNADLTPARLVGHHDPARVLREGYTSENFVDGPLLVAMRSGGLLYVEELNRAPEDAVNALLAAMAEREVAVPHVGVVVAADGFRIVASMNPFDNVGTVRLSSSVHDRMCRLAVGYQDADEERAIVAARAGDAVHPSAPAPARVIDDAVALTRATRSQPEIRQGASVRGAIDLARLVPRLLVLAGDDASYPDVVHDAMRVALSGRIVLDEAAETTPEAVLRRIWEDHFTPAGRPASPG